VTLLITGVSGQIGWELQRTLSGLGTVVAADRSKLDLSRRDSIVQAMRDIRPTLVVNPAAYTAVDLAESNEEAATAVNALAPGVLAEEAKRLGAGLVHFSTDYVFDGEKRGAYVETDPTNPLNVYGRTKLAGEQAIAAAGGRFLIFRTSWIYAARGKNFLQTILRLARERPEIRVVDDQRGAPTGARQIAEAVRDVLKKSTSCDWPSGLYHMTCAGDTTWFGFAQAILQRGLAPDTPRPALIPIASAEYPTAARRPKNSVLDNAKLAQTFGVRLPAWEAALAHCLRPAAA